MLMPGPKVTSISAYELKAPALYILFVDHSQYSSDPPSLPLIKKPTEHR